jgi:hypothetical protein
MDRRLCWQALYNGGRVGLARRLPGHRVRFWLMWFTAGHPRTSRREVPTVTDAEQRH